MPPTDQVEIVLSYDGPDVEDGAMSLDDLIPVLQGFGGAYSKVAAQRGISVQHRIRLTAIRKGSVALVLDVWDTVSRAVAHLDAKTVLTSAVAIVGVILKVVQAKKHVDKKPYATKIDNTTGTIQIVNSSNVSIFLSPEEFGLFKDGAIDSDLSKITSPLESGKVDTSTLMVRQGQTEFKESVSAEQRDIFQAARTDTTITRETWLTGQINSMTKSTNSGYMYLTDGTRVFYKLAGDHPEAYYHLFAHRGLVRVRCVANLDDSLRPVSLEIFEIIPLQQTLDFAESQRLSDEGLRHS